MWLCCVDLDGNNFTILGNGIIDFDEFYDMMNKQIEEAAEGETQLIEAFKVFDKDGAGYISAEKLRDVMINLGDILTQKEVNELIDESDVKGDGCINYIGKTGMIRVQELYD